MAIIETRHLCYRYDTSRLALDDINISIDKGKVTAILGGNGAGKSTLFLNLNGVLKPSSGEVFYHGTRVGYTRKDILNLRKSIGIVFQDPNDQLFSADVRGDISFGPMNLGWPEAEVRAAVERVSRQTGIEEYLDRPTHALSFGQKKRVAIAGVLAMNPEVIILDEPTAGLDPQGMSDILRLFSQLQKSADLTIIISTHDIDIVPLYCDNAYVLDHGRVVMAGSAGDLFCHADELRSHALRLPRIGHLMEILRREDGFDTTERDATISSARSSLCGLLNHSGSHLRA